MATVKREDNKVYIQHGDKMRLVGELRAGLMPGSDVPLPTILMVNRSQEHQLMHVWNAYGFAKEVMDHEDWFEYVHLTEVLVDGRTTVPYLIPRKDLIIHARTYQSDDFERQYFITREALQKYRLVIPQPS